MATRPVRALLYARRSIEEDDENQPGVTEQLDQARRYCEGQGWQVAGEFKDSDRSGWNGIHRDGFQGLLRAITDSKGLKVETIVVARALDRITRRVEVWAQFQAACIDAGVTRVVLYSGGELTLDAPTSKFTNNTLAGVAELYSDLISHNSREGKRRIAAKGIPPAQPPYGYRVDVNEKGDRTWTIEPAEADRIKGMARGVLAGRSLSEIARSLNEAGIPTARGAMWRTQQVRMLLLNPGMAGLRATSGEVVAEGNWTAILDRATWEGVRAVLTDPARGPGRRSSTLLGGIARCGFCGLGLYSSWSRGNQFYGCRSTFGCDRITVSTERLDEFVTEVVLATLEATSEVEAGLSDSVTGREAADLAEQLRALDAREDELAADFTQSPRFLRKSLDAIESERNRVERKLSELSKRMAGVTVPYGARARASWEQLDLSEQRAVISAVVTPVVVRARNSAKAPIDERVRFDWTEKAAREGTGDVA